MIENLHGHGTGRNLWEHPSVPGVEDRRDRTVLWEGLVLAIEPFLSTGATWADEAADGWTLVTPGHLAAQFEHTVVVTKRRPARPHRRLTGSAVLSNRPDRAGSKGRNTRMASSAAVGPADGAGPAQRRGEVGELAQEAAGVAGVDDLLDAERRRRVER